MRGRTCAQDIDGLAQAVGERHGRELQQRLPRETEELASEIGGAEAGELRCFEQHLVGIVRGNVGADHAEVAEDGGQQVVEIVRDAAGELADGIHLL